MKPELVARILELKAQGKSIRAIARQLKIGRDTVRDIVRGKTDTPSLAAEKEEGRKPKFAKLMPYQRQIVEMLDQHKLTAVRIFDALKKLGFDGGYTQVKDYVRGLRRSKTVTAITRFEVPPGRQAQIDWSVFPISFVGTGGGGGGEPVIRKLYCFGFVLSHCRVLYAEFFERMNFYSFLRGHVNAFAYIRGVPHECLYDNLKSVVLSRAPGGHVQWNEKFQAFARYYGFQTRACQVARAQTKGRIERAFHYVFEAFTNGRTFESLEDLNRRLRAWLEEANRRVHGTTGRVPLEALEEERPYLLPLPAVPFDTSEVRSVLCPLDGLVSFEGNRYSMPPTYVGKTALLRATEKEVVIECDGKVLARHERFTPGIRGRTKLDPAHYEGVVPPRRVRAHVLEEEFLRLGPRASAYLHGLKTRLAQGALSQVAKVLGLKLEYRIEDIHRAIEKALGYDAFGASFIQGILARDAARKPLDPGADALTSEDVARIREWIQNVQVQKRPLDAYREFLTKGDSHGEPNPHGHGHGHGQPGEGTGPSGGKAPGSEAEPDSGAVSSGS